APTSNETASAASPEAAPLAGEGGRPAAASLAPAPSTPTTSRCATPTAGVGEGAERTSHNENREWFRHLFALARIVRISRPQATCRRTESSIPKMRKKPGRRSVERRPAAHHGPPTRGGTAY